MRKYLQWGGYAASAIVIGIGIASVVAGVTGKSDVRDKLAQEKIVGTPDMGSIAGKPVDTGSEAKQFADIMREHALADTGGKTYAEMPRAVDAKTGEPVPPDQVEARLADGSAVPNEERDIWVTQVALSSALNTSYFAERVATFSIGVGLALILAGIGFLVFLVVPPRR